MQKCTLLIFISFIFQFLTAYAFSYTYMVQQTAVNNNETNHTIQTGGIVSYMNISCNELLINFNPADHCADIGDHDEEEIRRDGMNFLSDMLNLGVFFSYRYAIFDYFDIGTLFFWPYMFPPSLQLDFKLGTNNSELYDFNIAFLAGIDFLVFDEDYTPGAYASLLLDLIVHEDITLTLNNYFLYRTYQKREYLGVPLSYNISLAITGNITDSSQLILSIDYNIYPVAVDSEYGLIIHFGYNYIFY